MDSQTPFVAFPSLNQKQLTVATLCIFIYLAAIILNLLLLILLLWKPQSSTFKRSNLILLLNLSVRDCMLSIFGFVLALKKVSTRRAHTEKSGCRLEAMMLSSLTLNALFSVLLLSIDRYVTVVRRKLLAPRTCLWMMLGCAITAILLGSFPVALDPENFYKLQPSGYYCFVDLSQTNPKLRYIAYPNIIIYFSCLLVIMFAYAKILRAIHRTFKNFITLNPPVMSVSSSNTSETSGAQSNHDMTDNQIELRIQWASTEKEKNKNYGDLTNEKKRRRLSQHSNRSRRALEIQLSKKTFLIGISHILLYIPMGVCIILQSFNIGGLSELDFVGIVSISVCLILDPFWSLVLDQQIKKKRMDLIERFKNF